MLKNGQFKWNERNTCSSLFCEGILHFDKLFPVSLCLKAGFLFSPRMFNKYLATNWKLSSFNDAVLNICNRDHSVICIQLRIIYFCFELGLSRSKILNYNSWDFLKKNKGQWNSLWCDVFHSCLVSFWHRLLYLHRNIRPKNTRRARQPCLTSDFTSGPGVLLQFLVSYVRHAYTGPSDQGSLGNRSHVRNLGNGRWKG